MAEGRIIKALSGFYYVKNGDDVIQCRARGNFRKRKITPLVGDFVTYEAENPTDGYILSLEERKNELNRPPIANVDQTILVFSANEPSFDASLLDRFLVHIESHDITSLICITKLDLVTKDEMEQIQIFVEIYRAIGYEVLLTSSETGDGIEGLRPFLADHISVVAGQSGVGKSSLLNAIDSRFNILTDIISVSLGRGKHTTRHVELLPVGTGYVADTPGFSSLEFAKIEAEDLSFCFPEMRRLGTACKFRGCTHLTEPGCAVKAAIANDDISQSRYDHYHQFYDEIKSRKRRY